MKVREKGDDLFLKKLGERISMLRKEKGITQVELALRLEIEKSNMSRIEAGNTNPTILLLQRISVLLGVQLTDLLKNITEETT